MGAQTVESQDRTMKPPAAPGVIACLIVAGLAWGVATLEELWLGKAWIEPLVLAILIGAGARLGTLTVSRTTLNLKYLRNGHRDMTGTREFPGPMYIPRHGFTRNPDVLRGAA